MEMGNNAKDDGGADQAPVNQEFDPATYLQTFYTAPWVDFEGGRCSMSWLLACLHRAFTEGDISGETLVDIGSGPTLYQLMSGCEIFNKVFLTEFLEVNRQELRRWLHEEKSLLDWTPFFQHVCKLEGREPSAWREKAARLREVVVDVLPVDVLRPQPLSTDVLPPAGADCLVSFFCLECPCRDLETFTRALGHIGSLLKPNGHLLLATALGMSSYDSVPGFKLPVLQLTEAQICASLKESGFTLIWTDVYTMPLEMVNDSDDMTAIFFAKARKD